MRWVCRPEAEGGGKRQAGANGTVGADGRPRGTHIANGGSSGRRRHLRDDVQLFLCEALGLIQREARVEHCVLHEDARGAQHKRQEHVHVDVVARAVQPPAGRATSPWVRARGRSAGRRLGCVPRAGSSRRGMEPVKGEKGGSHPGPCPTPHRLCPAPPRPLPRPPKIGQDEHSHGKGGQGHGVSHGVDHP